MSTAVKNCSCKHSYQDTHFGEGKRLMNKVNGKIGTWRCTVCDKETSSDTAKKK